MAIPPTRPTIKPWTRAIGHALYRFRADAESTQHNDEYNTQARFYNSKLKDAYGIQLRGTRCKYMRLVNLVTGSFVNNNRYDTPATMTEIDAFTMAEWDDVNTHYRLGWTAATLIAERRKLYRVFIGLY